MKFNEYLNLLNEFAKKHPESLNLDVISSIDEEGNGYNNICYEPTMGIIEDLENFIDINDEESFGEDGYSKENINAVCIN